MAERFLFLVLTVYDVVNKRNDKLILSPSTPPNVDVVEEEGDHGDPGDHLPNVGEQVGGNTKQGDASYTLALDDQSKSPSLTAVSPTPTPKLHPSHTLLLASVQKGPVEVRNNIFKMPTTTTTRTPTYPGGIKAYYQAKIESAELTINERTQNLRRLEAQRNALNARG